MTTKIKHDELFRKALENKMVAKEFFEFHLPDHIKSELCYETLKIEKESFVEQNIKNSISDVLFSAKFNHEDGYLYLLLEHQSTPDHFMDFSYIDICLTFLTVTLSKTQKQKNYLLSIL